MLPHEIFTLVLLCTRALAIPQGSPIEQNATITSYPFTEHSQEKVHLESTAPGWEDTIQPTEQPITWDPCAPNGCHELTVHLESSQTGWLSLATSITQGHSNTPQSTQILKQELVPIHSPSLVGLRTEIQSGVQDTVATPKETPNTSPPFAKVNLAPASPQETPAQNPLLQEIISKLGVQPPSLPNAPTPPPEPNHASPATEITTEGDVTVPLSQATNTNAPSSQMPSESRITSLPQITLGTTTLTLTPGLSSLLNVPPFATYIALATNGQGQTLITVSAGGTAVTATIVGGGEAGVTGVVRAGGGDAKDEDVVTRMSRGVAGRREVWGVGWGVGLWVVMG